MRFLFTPVLMSMLALTVIADDTQTGVWYGVMDVGVREFRFRIEPVDSKEVAEAFQLVSLDEGGQVFPLDNFKLDDSSLSFEIKPTKAAYSGTLSEDKTTVAGKWKQRGAEFDLVMRHFEKAPEDAPSEVWTGTISLLFQKLVLRVRVYEVDGAERVRFDSVSQKAGGFKAVRSINGEKWTIEVNALGGAFVGAANTDTTEVKGKWTQGGAAMDLTLVRDETVVPESTLTVVRPQTPRPPFPYRVEVVAIQNTADGVTLAGTLTLPKQGGPFPAAILITGSGPQDRDESLLDHRPFAVMADHQTRSGIAVLRFDDRGTWESTGNFATATSEDFANDAEAAFEFLLKDKRVDPRKIGLIGHSEGGIIAPIVAARRKDVAFAVLLAGTGVNGREILLSQGQLILKAEGIHDEVSLKAQRDTQTAIIEAAANEDLSERQVEAMLEKLESLLPEDARKDDSLKETLKSGITTFRTPWFRYFLTHEPGPVLERVTCPVLALNGEKDVQVDPKLNLPAIRAALEKSGHPRYEIVELKGLNHLFQTCITGGVSEYQRIEETMSPLALEKMTAWILQIAEQ